MIPHFVDVTSLVVDVTLHVVDVPFVLLQVQAGLGDDDYHLVDLEDLVVLM